MTSRTATAAAPVDDDLALVVFGLDVGGKAHASRFKAADAELARKAAGMMAMRAMPVVTDEQRAAAAGLPQGRIFASGKGFVPFVKAAVYARLSALAGPPDKPPPDEPCPARGKANGTSPDKAWAEAEAPAADAEAAAAEGSEVPRNGGNDGDPTKLPGSSRSSNGGDHAQKPHRAKAGRKAKWAEDAASHLPENFVDIQHGSLVLAPEHDYQNWWPAIAQRPWGKRQWVLRWKDFPDEKPFTRPTRDLALLHPDHSPEG